VGVCSKRRSSTILSRSGENFESSGSAPEEDAIWIFLKDIHCRMLMPLSRYYKMNRHHLISQSALAAD
jgi:hypothetical protein